MCHKVPGSARINNKVNLKSGNNSSKNAKSVKEHQKLSFLILDYHNYATESTETL